MGQPNVMGLLACQSAYEHGEEWLEELKEYLFGNLSLVRCFLSEKLSSVKLVEPEGTYLIWLDFRLLDLSDHEIDGVLLQKARLWFDAGSMFGAGGEGFQRLNIACPKSVLQEALERMELAFNSK